MGCLLRSLVVMAVARALAAGQIHFTAVLDGSQEVPPVTTNATGTGSFTLSSDFTRLTWSVSYEGLSGTLSAGGHFHTGAQGTNGPVVKSIASGGDPASNTISGVWTSTDATQPFTRRLVDSLLMGRMYVNFHTSANPGGEIRGQIRLATGLHFTANLNGAQENPPVVTNAGGTAACVLSPDRTQLSWYITYRDLSGTLTAGGHFHVADSGRNGPIAKNIASGGGPASATSSGVWAASDATQPLTAALVDSIIVGKVYVNYHTAANPDGEIRGQLKLQGGTGFVAMLNGAQENPPVATSATGTGSFALNDARTELRYDITYINLSGTLSAGGHFHVADSGRNGPIARDIASSGGPASGTVSGVWRSTDGQALTPVAAESLLTGRIYANFHTAANPAGEIRGQLLLTTGLGFTSRLDGSQENPPVTTSGRGTGFIALSPDRRQATYRVTYHGLSGPLSGTGGHFHVARVGANGPIVRDIAPGGNPAAATVGGTWVSTDASQPLTRALADSLISGKIYANLHTAANPGGEVRGQARHGSDFLTSVSEIPRNVPTGFHLEQNHPNPFNPSTTIGFKIQVSGFTSLKVYDLLGQEVATLVNELKQPGSYDVKWNASGMASGVYLYRLDAGGRSETRRMILVR